MYNILITAIGKRVQLINHLKKNFNIIGIDCGIDNPASRFVNKFYQVPKFSSDNYVNIIIDICKNEEINIIIPLYEKEFTILLDNKELFEGVGTKILLSDKNIINICNDKFNTYKFFVDNNLLTPKSYLKNDIISNYNLSFPMIIKPLDGMGSEGVYKIENQKELDFFRDYIDNPIIQEFVYGVEYTIDVLCDFFGNIISIVPRERIQVRSGEVSKSRTIKNYDIIYKTKGLIEKLNSMGNVIGPITVQCIVNSNNDIYFIEINPRFGGGVPLTFEAGINYGYYILNMIKNKKIENIIGNFKEITMLRYDEAVFI